MLTPRDEDAVRREFAKLAGPVKLVVFSQELAAADLCRQNEMLVREVAGRFGDEAARAQSPLQLSTPAPVVGRWDRLRIEQVVTNLITNAIKFGAGKPIELAVSEANDQATISVADHGIGVAPQDIERIFKRYEQAISSREYGGMGLGLYIVRQIVGAHGGTIRVASRLGEGSTFIVDLPREHVATP